MDKPASDKAGYRNELLRAMSDASFEAVTRLLEPVAMPVRMKLAEAGKVTQWVHFLEDGIASVVSQGARAAQEIGIIGRDGAACHLALLSHDVAPYATFMQVEGHGHRIRSDLAIRLASEDRELHSLFIRYTHAFGIQVSQTAIANVQCNISERLARWILMVEDRLGRPTVNITHEFLAMMLGVGRTGVTLALQELERGGLIKTGRKRIEVRDRLGMEAYAGGYYGFAEKQYRRLIGPPSLLAFSSVLRPIQPHGMLSAAEG